MNKKYGDLVQRIAELHDIWFLDAAAPPGGGARYRILEKQRGKPLFEDFRTIGEVNSFLDGYVIGLEHGQRGWK
jgi:hypothetical protein